MSEVNAAEKYGIVPQHVGIHVSDFERTYEWYRDLFGFERVPGKRSKAVASGVFPKMIWLEQKGTGFRLEVYEVQNAEPFTFVDYEWKLGVKHLNFEVSDLSGWLEMVEARGDVPILVNNVYSETDGAVYITDPDGILVEVTGGRGKK